MTRKYLIAGIFCFLILVGVALILILGNSGGDAKGPRPDEEVKEQKDQVIKEQERKEQEAKEQEVNQVIKEQEVNQVIKDDGLQDNDLQDDDLQDINPEDDKDEFSPISRVISQQNYEKKIQRELDVKKERESQILGEIKGNKRMTCPSQDPFSIKDISTCFEKLFPNFNCLEEIPDSQKEKFFSEIKFKFLENQKDVFEGEESKTGNMNLFIRKFLKFLTSKSCEIQMDNFETPGELTEEEIIISEIQSLFLNKEELPHFLRLPSSEWDRFLKKKGLKHETGILLRNIFLCENSRVIDKAWKDGEGLCFQGRKALESFSMSDKIQLQTGTFVISYEACDYLDFTISKFFKALKNE